MKSQMWRNQVNRWVAEENGQAIVEYILMLSLAISLIGALGFAFQKIIAYLWQVYTREVTALCPNCPPPEEVKNKLFSGACKTQ